MNCPQSIGRSNGRGAQGGKAGKKKTTLEGNQSHLEVTEGDSAANESSFGRSMSTQRGSTQRRKSTDGSVVTYKSRVSKTSKLKRKPASRSKSFDGCVFVATASTRGSEKSPNLREIALVSPPTKQRQMSEGLRASSDHHSSSIKFKQQHRRQVASTSSGMPEQYLQTAKNQVAVDPFLERRPSSQGQSLIVLSVEETPSPTDKAAANKGRNPKSKKLNTQPSDARRDGTTQSKGQSNADPNNAYFQKDPNHSQSVSKSHRRSSSKSRSRSRGRRRSSLVSSSKVEKPKLPARTISDSSLQLPGSQHKQPSPLLGPDRDENNVATPQTSLSVSQPKRRKSSKTSMHKSGEGSLLESKSSDPVSSCGTANHNNSISDSQTIGNGVDQPLRPSTRETSFSNRGKSKTGGMGLEQENKCQQSLLGVHGLSRQYNPCGEKERLPTEGSLQVNERVIDTLSKSKEQQLMPGVAQEKANENASVPIRKKNSFDYDEFENESDRDVNSKGKSLCGLLPQTKKSINTESSIAGASLPELMDSSFSSVYSGDQSVCTYLSRKREGLIVPADVKDGPMKAFLGSLTSAIEKKRISGPPLCNSYDDQSLDLSLNERAEKAGSQSKGVGRFIKPPSFGASLNAVFVSSAVNKISPSVSKVDDDSMPLPSLTSCGTKAAESGMPLLEADPEREEGEMSVPSLMAYEKRRAGALATLPQQDDEMSPPSLMHHGVNYKGDTSVIAPCLDPAQSAGTALLEMDNSLGSMPSLISMTNDPSSVRRRGQGNGRGRSHPGKSENPLYAIDDGDIDIEEEREHDSEEEEHDKEAAPNAEGEHGKLYGESMKETNKSALDESNVEDNESEEGNYKEGGAEEMQLHTTKGDHLFEEDQEDCTDEENDVEQNPASHYASQEQGGISGRRPSQRGRRTSNGKQSIPMQDLQQPPDFQYVVKPKKKEKKSKPASKKIDAKQEQVQMWQEEFQQEQMMQQQLLFWQQQQLWQQHMLQQQFWMNTGNGMNMAMHMNPSMMIQHGVMPTPTQFMDGSDQMITRSNCPMDSSIANGNVGMGFFVDSNHPGSVQHTKPKPLIVKTAPNLEYDFSFMDHPGILRVAEVSVEDVLQPMNPSFDQGNINDSEPRRSKERKERKAPSLVVASWFKKSVKKLKSGFGRTKQKAGGKIDTGLNERQFFPDLDDDDNEESTMKGLLSG